MRDPFSAPLLTDRESHPAPPAGDHTPIRLLPTLTHLPHTLIEVEDIEPLHPNYEHLLFGLGALKLNGVTNKDSTVVTHWRFKRG